MTTSLTTPAGACLSEPFRLELVLDSIALDLLIVLRVIDVGERNHESNMAARFYNTIPEQHRCLHIRGTSGARMGIHNREPCGWGASDSVFHSSAKYTKRRARWIDDSNSTAVD